MISELFVLIGAASLAAAPLPLAAQVRRDSIEIQTRALEYARSKVGEGRVFAVDTASVVGLSGERAGGVSRDAIVRALGSAKAGTRADFIVCADERNFSTCTLRDVDAVVTLSQPRIKQDTAFIDVRFQERRTGRMPISQAEDTLRLERRDGHWIFSRVTRRSQT